MTSAPSARSIASLPSEFDPTPQSPCQTVSFVRRDEAVWYFAGLSLPLNSVTLCITVYNEEASTLTCSLKGLVNNFAKLREADPNVNVAVFIVVDGYEKCSASMRAALASILCLPDFGKPEPQELACYYRAMDLPMLAETLAAEPKPEFDTDSHRSLAYSNALYPHSAMAHGADDSIHLVLGIKGKNCGKLDSHWWYYRAFCPAIEPAYCFQMDVGTIPSGHALSELLNTFYRSPRIGAVAGSILPNRPKSAWDALQCWQYMSFANSVLLEWPAESTVGFLSVVPGQLSAFRWDAIREAPNAGTPATEQSRLDVYFKGLESLTPQESMLYAAEDRVLCRELVFNAQSGWTIAHVDGAVAITDACQSWGELLRQRKRWCNGYLACRIIYLKKLPYFIGSGGVSLRRKLQASAAAMYHSLVMLADWFALAISVLVVLSATQQAQLLTDPSSLLRPVIAGSMYAAFAAMAVQFLFCWRGRISSSSIAVFGTSLAVQAAVIGGAMLVLLLSPGHFLLKGMLAIQLLATPVASLFGHRRLTSAVARSAPANFLALYVIPLALWMFAVTNSHNSSWGTKGLVSSPIDGGLAGNTGQRQKYLTFRKHYVLAWLATNAWAVYQCIQRWGLNSYDLLTHVVGISCLLLVFGLACRIFQRLSR